MLVQQRRDQPGLAVCGEGAFAGRHLVQDGAEREQIGARIHVVPLNLLRGHVWHRAHHDPHVRERSRRRRVVDARRRRRSCSLARPKCRTFTPVFVIMTLAGFESRWTMPARCAAASASASWVAIRSVSSRGRARPPPVPPGRASAPVDGDIGEDDSGVGVAPADPAGEARTAAASREPGGKCLAFEELHDEELNRMSAGILLTSNVVDRADVRVAERGDDARFALESRLTVGIPGHRGRQHLDGDIAPEPRVTRPVDVAEFRPIRSAG